MSDFTNSAAVTTGSDVTSPQSGDAVDGSTLPVESGATSPLVGTEDNLTISTFETAGESNTVANSEGVESPSANTTGATAQAEQSAAAQTTNTEQAEEEDPVDETETTAAEDIALASSSVLANALLVAAEANNLELEPTQAILNRFKQADDANDTGAPDSPALVNGRLSIDFDMEVNQWNAPADGLTESFAAAMARFNQDPTAASQSVSLGGLLGYELIKA